MTQVLIFVVGLLAFGAGAAFVWWRSRPAAEEAEYHYCRCPGCEQKIRYQVSRGGLPAQCPRCRRRFNLPMEGGLTAPAPPRSATGYLVGSRR